MSTYGLGDGLLGHHTANGEHLTRHELTFASHYPGQRAGAGLPFGTIVEFRYRGHTVRARCNDRGPYVGCRSFDLGPALAHELHFRGVGRVEWRIIKKPRHRTHAK